LVRRGIDEMLLKPIEDYPAIWMASSAVLKKENINDTHKLEKMFQNRFDYRLETELPERKEMLKWLIDRCKLLGLQAETPEATLQRLMERSNRVPGMALQVLNKAHKTRNKILTQKMVENHVFDFDN
jgi:hypothetical protein